MTREGEGRGPRAKREFDPITVGSVNNPVGSGSGSTGDLGVVHVYKGSYPGRTPALTYLLRGHAGDTLRWTPPATRPCGCPSLTAARTGVPSRAPARSPVPSVRRSAAPGSDDSAPHRPATFAVACPGWRTRASSISACATGGTGTQSGSADTETAEARPSAGSNAWSRTSAPPGSGVRGSACGTGRTSASGGSSGGTRRSRRASRTSRFRALVRTRRRGAPCRMLRTRYPAHPRSDPGSRPTSRTSWMRRGRP